MNERPTDQAETLRSLSKEKGRSRESSVSVIKHRRKGSTEDQGGVRVLAVTSGKGGVGKTNVVANLAFGLSKLGKRVMVLDADVGLANMDVLLGLSPKFHLGHVFSGQKRLEEIIVPGPGGIRIIPASSGIQELVDLTREQRLSIMAELNALDGDIDILLIDTSAGISSNVTYFNLLADEIIVLASSEPTSITDAYALMKVLFLKYGEKSFKLLVNAIRNDKEAREVFLNLSTVAERFLNLSIDYWGFIPHDPNLPKAVCKQKLLMELYPESKASLGIEKLAKKIWEMPSSRGLKGNIKLFGKAMMIDGNLARDGKKKETIYR
jgi:flagellar biosynthesis protein FlhG